MEDTNLPETASDGFHTFKELYEHRMVLFLALMHSYRQYAWRSKKHHPKDDPIFEGYFIAGMNLPTGQVTYHYKLDEWDTFDHIRCYPTAPKWDGHTPETCVERLKEFALLQYLLNKRS